MKKSFPENVFVTATDLMTLGAEVKKASVSKSKKETLHGIGDTKSPFKSRGMEFQEVRAYQPGDDARTIDWRVTAKHGKPFTKLYTDERARPVTIIADMRSRLKFASAGAFKSVLSAKITALLAWICVYDHALLNIYIILPDKIKHFQSLKNASDLIPVFQTIESALDPTDFPKETHTPSDAITVATCKIRAGSSVFIIGDLIDLSDNARQKLKGLSEKNSVVLMPLYDSLESILPTGKFGFTDGIQKITVDIDSQTQKRYARQFQDTQQSLDSFSSQSGIAYTPYLTTDNVIQKTLALKGWR